jgi:ATP-binding cassette subfamily B protein
MKVLLRLMPYVRAHIWAFSFGMAGLLVARVFEAMIPMYIKMGIDSLTEDKPGLDLDSTATQDALFYPAMAIILCVISQMLVTIVSRILIRRIGMYAAFDLRNRIYHHLQLQGPGFFQQYSIGDLMARAINDISLVRQVIAGSTRMTMVLIFTATVGLMFMFS